MALPYTFGSGTQLDKLFLTQLQLDLDQLQADIATLQATKAGVAQTSFVTRLVEAPALQDYTVIEKIPFGATLTSFSGDVFSGTLTATLKIGTTAVTGGTLNVTTVQGTSALTALNVMAANDLLIVTVSAVSSPRPVDFSYMVVFTYNLSAV